MTTIDEAVAAADFGSAASARKAGRRKGWPYVPVILTNGRQAQVLARAFATRDEAVAYAEQMLVEQRRLLAEKLANPRYRALRRQHGIQ